MNCFATRWIGIRNCVRSLERSIRKNCRAVMPPLSPKYWSRLCVKNRPRNVGWPCATKSSDRSPVNRARNTFASIALSRNKNLFFLKLPRQTLANPAFLARTRPSLKAVFLQVHPRNRSLPMNSMRKCARQMAWTSCSRSSSGPGFGSSWPRLRICVHGAFRFA